MVEEYFVDKHSIVRQIWGKSDTILFIFAGASAEFALNKAVDWLYFTGRLPADPLARLFSTVSYARAIVFAEKQTAMRTIDAIAGIHAQVESQRKAAIPDWAYRDVLFMLIDYSIRSYELLERKLTSIEKVEVFRVFCRVGDRMGLKNLPQTFMAFEIMRHNHLRQDLQYSAFTADLYRQYRKQLGSFRYKILVEAQKLLVPQHVRRLLGFSKVSVLYPLLSLYKLSKILRLDELLKELILPVNYQNQIKSLNSAKSTIYRFNQALAT